MLVHLDNTTMLMFCRYYVYSINATRWRLHVNEESPVQTESLMVFLSVFFNRTCLSLEENYPQ